MTVEAEIIQIIHVAPRGHYATRLLPGQILDIQRHIAGCARLSVPAEKRSWQTQVLSSAYDADTLRSLVRSV